MKSRTRSPVFWFGIVAAVALLTVMIGMRSSPAIAAVDHDEAAITTQQIGSITMDMSGDPGGTLKQPLVTAGQTFDADESDGDLRMAGDTISLDAGRHGASGKIIGDTETLGLQQITPAKMQTNTTYDTTSSGAHLASSHGVTTMSMWTSSLAYGIYGIGSIIGLFMLGGAILAPTYRRMVAGRLHSFATKALTTATRTVRRWTRIVVTDLPRFETIGQRLLRRRLHTGSGLTRGQPRVA